MMKKPDASPAKWRSAIPPEHALPRGLRERRPARSRTFAALLVPTLAAALAACQGAPLPSPPPAEDDALSSMQQELSTAACRQDLRSCLANGGGVSDLGQCTLDFEGCFTQAALDGLGQGQLLSQCRSVADDCLSGVVAQGDASACGDVLIECADDALDEVRGVFPLLRPLVSRVLTVPARSIRGLVDLVDGLPAIALSGVRTCRDEVATCVDGALDNLDIGACADGLDVCVDKVVDIIDPVLDPLPGPNASGVLTGTAACRMDAKDCLVGAVKLTDIRVCGDVLGTCIDEATALLDETVDDVNGVVGPLPVAVPKPSNLVDCTLQLTQCLAGLNNPFDCADQARACAAP
jgi:hypothetical protein